MIYLLYKISNYGLNLMNNFLLIFNLHHIYIKPFQTKNYDPQHRSSMHKSPLPAKHEAIHEPAIRQILICHINLIKNYKKIQKQKAITIEKRFLPHRLLQKHNS
jgi:hypothetical protein